MAKKSTLLLFLTMTYVFNVQATDKESYSATAFRYLKGYVTYGLSACGAFCGVTLSSLSYFCLSGAAKKCIDNNTPISVSINKYITGSPAQNIQNLQEALPAIGVGCAIAAVISLYKAYDWHKKANAYFNTNDNTQHKKQ